MKQTEQNTTGETKQEKQIQTNKIKLKQNKSSKKKILRSLRNNLFRNRIFLN